MLIPTIEITSSVFHTVAWGLPGGSEWIILLVLGLLIFGRRLPEVGRSLGRGIVEFKKGIRGIEEEIDDEVSRADRRLENSNNARQELPRSMPTTEPANPYSASSEEARREM